MDVIPRMVNFCFIMVFRSLIGSVIESWWCCFAVYEKEQGVCTLSKRNRNGFETVTFELVYITMNLTNLLEFVSTLRAKSYDFNAIGFCLLYFSNLTWPLQNLEALSSTPVFAKQVYEKFARSSVKSFLKYSK